MLFANLGDLEAIETALQAGDVCAVIVEGIQGIGGLDEASTEFYQKLSALCKQYEALYIADEIQCGYGRTGDFFAFQKHGIIPDVISLAKGMGNGFPVGGILIHPSIKASFGLLGTTFGGNHLACAAALAVLEVMETENLMQQVKEVSAYFIEKAKAVPLVKQVKGRGLMLGLQFDFPIADLRKQLIFNHNIFTGSAKDPNILRILPPLTLRKTHVDAFFEALQTVLKSLAN